MIRIERSMAGWGVIAAFAAAAFCAPAMAQDKTKLRVMGMPLATGKIQKDKEQPFFENFARETGLPIEMDYKPLDSTGVKEFEQLRVIKSGLFDIVGLRLGQVSRDEPTILGLDLVGLNTDYKVARKVVDAYKDSVDLRLQDKFNTKLLGVWPFGPQIIFCKPAIASLDDLKGKKVRILDGVMARFMEKIGATPVTMAFGEVSQGLKLGTIDCAVTGPSSANSAGWPESATHVYPLGMRCNAGQDPCTTGKKYALKTVKPTAKDLELMKSALKEIALPAWSELCEKSNPGCTDTWKRTVGPVIGLK